MNNEKLDHARWVLERNLHWIAIVETKTAVILTIDTAMSAALAVAYCDLTAAQRTPWSTLFAILAAFPIALSIIYAALAVWPQMSGPDTSFIFFGKIKAQPRDRYQAAFMAATDDDLLSDCTAQIHRNAEIATEKYARITVSMKLAFVSLPVWLIAIGQLIAARS